ncbi:MAG: hypothetical protein HRU04_24305 [Oceanospirillaceae bacterium]|nr:hypothetical protein [Oceanospirillaceae bacterium]
MLNILQLTYSNKNRRRSLLFLILSIVMLINISKANADVITLTLPSFKDGSHIYYYNLLINALKSAGHTPIISLSEEMPQNRVIHELKRDRISLYWLLKTQQRDQAFTPINVGLTNGLIGQRILLIPPDKQSEFNGVKSLSDFRALQKTGGFGSNWYDIKVWRANRLKYQVVPGDWHKIYNMLVHDNRDIDYFSRGVIEISAEAKLHPELQIEKTLLLIYERDFVFYISGATQKYEQILFQALSQAKNNNLIVEMQRDHWQKDFRQLQLDSRTIIRLEQPE